MVTIFSSLLYAVSPVLMKVKDLLLVELWLVLMLVLAFCFFSLGEEVCVRLGLMFLNVFVMYYKELSHY